MISVSDKYSTMCILCYHKYYNIGAYCNNFVPIVNEHKVNFSDLIDTMEAGRAVIL